MVRMLGEPSRSSSVPVAKVARKSRIDPALAASQTTTMRYPNHPPRTSKTSASATQPSTRRSPPASLNVRGKPSRTRSAGPSLANLPVGMNGRQRQAAVNRAIVRASLPPSKDEAESSNSYHTPPTQSPVSSPLHSPDQPTPPSPNVRRQSSSIRDEFVDADALSIGSGEDPERHAPDAAASNSESGDATFSSQHFVPPSNSASGSGLLSDLSHRNIIRERMTSIFEESELQDSSIHYSESSCFENVSLRRKLYRVIPAGARVMYFGAARRRWSRFARAYDVWQASDRVNHQPLYNAFMSVYDLPLNSCTRMRGKNKNKTTVLNRRFESIINEIAFDDELRAGQAQSSQSSESDDNQPERPRSRTDIQSERDFDHQSAIAAEKYVKDCYLSRAMKRLCKKRNSNTKTYDSILNDLRSLHPQRSSSIPHLPAESPHITVNPDDPRFYNLMKSMDNGSAAGLSGMTGNMLAILADDADCRRYVAQFIQAVVNGDLPDNIRRVLLASHLIGIPKPNNGTRPIAIGEVLYRLASRYALSLIQKADLKNIFLPHQFGVDIAAGCESVVHFVQQALDDKSAPYYALCIDMKNAFNEVKRDEMITSLFAHNELGPIFRLAHWSYSSPTPLITKDGQGHLAFIDDLLSSEGTRQGANESSLLFGLPLQRLLKQLAERYIGLKIVSILDDVTLLHRDPAVLIDAFDWLKREAESMLRLIIQPSKCQFIYFNHTDVDRLSLLSPSLIDSIKSRARIQVDGACLLGSAVGRTDDILHRLLTQQIGTTHDDLFKRVLNTSLHIQPAMLLLRQCLVPKLIYILRTVRPSATARIAATFDKQVIECALKLLELNRETTHWKDEVLTQLRLPCSMSGFGLRSAVMVSHYAYLDSASRALHLDHITNQLFTPSSTSASFTRAIDACITYTNNNCKPAIDDVKKLVPQSATAFFRTYHTVDSNVHHLQSLLTHENEKQIFRSLREAYIGSEYHSARLLATSAKGAAVWKIAVPVDVYCRLSDAEYIIATRVNLGLAPSEAMPNICGQCRRRVGVDDCSTHALSCNYLKGTLATDRHDSIQSCIERFASQVHLDIRRHQRTDRFSSDKRTTDFTIQTGSKACAWDVVCKHPTCPSEVHAASKTQLSAAQHASRDKHRHHHVDVAVSQAHIEPVLRQQPDFKAFACESYGGLHHDADQLIRDLCIRAQDHLTVFTDYEVKYGLRASIACAIQRFNAAMILENIYQASLPAAPTAPTYHMHASDVQPVEPSVSLSSVPDVQRPCVRSDRAARLNSQPLTQLSSQLSIDSISGEPNSDEEVVVVVDVASLSVNALAHEFTRTLDGVPQAMHDAYDDAHVVALDMRRSSMCLSRAFSLSLDASGSQRSVRSSFVEAANSIVVEA
jgi:hypothetical protein